MARKIRRFVAGLERETPPRAPREIEEGPIERVWKFGLA
jgi:hypothetical protein